MRRGCRRVHRSAWAGTGLWSGRWGEWGKSGGGLTCPVREARRRGGCRHEQVVLVPDEVVLAVHRQLVVLAHENGADRAGLFAVATEDAARLVNLVDRRV